VPLRSAREKAGRKESERSERRFGEKMLDIPVDTFEK
jgi:hypothetical protein